MPAAEFELRVTFRAYKDGPCPYTIHAMNRVPGVTLHEGHFQKADELGRDSNVQVDTPRVVLRFRITAQNGMKGDLYPVGIAFTRADGTDPVGIAPTTGGRRLPQSPFRSVRLNQPPGTVEITDQIWRRLPTINKKLRPHTHNTYQFFVVIQRRETGEIGIIDPQIENLN